MPNIPVPAAAEGLPLARKRNPYLEATDLIYEVKQHTDLISMALDSISLDRELSAIAGGITTLQRKIEHVEELLAPDQQELDRLEGVLQAHVHAFIVVNALAEDADPVSSEVSRCSEEQLFEIVLRFRCQTMQAKVRKVDYIIQHMRRRNQFDPGLSIDILRELLESLLA